VDSYQGSYPHQPWEALPLHSWVLELGGSWLWDPHSNPSHPIAAGCVLWGLPGAPCQSPSCSACTSPSSPPVLGTEPAAPTGECLTTPCSQRQGQMTLSLKVVSALAVQARMLCDHLYYLRMSPQRVSPCLEELPTPSALCTFRVHLPPWHCWLLALSMGMIPYP
jgi:hypothetical protein